MNALKQDKATRPAILIASSTEGMPAARALEVQLEPHAEVTVWTDELFGLSTGTLESLVKACQGFDAAALVLTPDDSVESRGQLFQAPRDNLLFELGLFMGKLGQQRTYLVYCRDEDVKLPSDLAGVTAATFAKRSDGNLIRAMGPVATRVLNTLKRVDTSANATLSFVDTVVTRLRKSHCRERVEERLSALTALASARVWPENKVDVERIADRLVAFENQGWAERQLVVYFGQHATKPITVYHLLDALLPLDPAKLNLCLNNILKQFESGAVVVISIRDLFEGHAEDDFAATQAYLAAADLVQQVHEATSDVLMHPAQARARQIAYKGALPKALRQVQIHEAVNVMRRMQQIGAELVSSGLILSPTHVVMSWLLDEEGYWMIVTATNTYKDKLLLFAETPIVGREGDQLVYFGDGNRLPSSEAIPHLVLHRELRHGSAGAFRAILHLHSHPLNALARDGDVDLGEGWVIPTVPHVGYGTEELGRLLAERMLAQGVLAASIRNHGQWYVADSFSKALETAKEAHLRACAAIDSRKGDRRNLV